jgi:HK97 family phage prohead protease
MPYFITDKAEGCSGWATTKEDGEVIGCHTTKQDAIDQMVAVSLAEDMEPGGERIASGPQAVIVDIDDTLISNGRLIERTYNFLDDMEDTEIIIVTGRNVSDRDATVAELDSLSVDYDRLIMNPGSTAETTAFKKATAEKLLEEYNVILAIDNNENNRKAYRDLGITALDVSDIPDVPSDENNDDEEDNVRAINQDAPNFMRAAARRGLEFYADGKAGDGLTEKTVREARLMAEGKVSDEKWIRIAAWIARHLPDLEAPAANPSDDNYPSAGVVAHFLWGSGATKAQARRTMEYAERVVERIRAEEEDRNTLQNDKWKSIALNLNKDERQQMTTQVERRVNTVEFDVRNGEASSDGMSFTGYAAVFNSPSEPLPFTEVIKEGAFKRSLKSRNEIKLFMNHNTDVVLGSTRAGTLKLSEDSRGLLAQAELPDTSAGRDLSVLMKRGDVSSMSFGFSVPPKGDAWSSDGATRELHQVRLHEVSIVTGFPAYEATTASVRSLDILATRTAVDVDALSDAITRLEAGETLDPDHADLISEVVSKLRADKPNEMELLEIKRKQLDLMLKAF